MSGFVKKVGIIRLAILSVLLPALFYSVLFLSLYTLTEAPETISKVSSTVSGEDIVLTLSSSNVLRAGEEATFYIDITNEGEEYIHRIDFVGKVKAVSLFGLKVYSTEEYSDRGFESGKSEKLVKRDSIPPKEILPKKITLSAYVFPGEYAIELIAQPSGMSPLPPARVETYVQAPRSTVFYPLLLMIASGTIYFAFYTTRGGRVLMRHLKSAAQILERSLQIEARGLEKTRFIGQLAEEKLQGYLTNISIGQRFVLYGLCLVVVSGVVLIVGLKNPSNDIAILAYNFLLLGVINLVWEATKESKPGFDASDSPSRMAFSWFIYASFVYFSTLRTIPFKALGILIGTLSVYTYVRYLLSLFTK